MGNLGFEIPVVEGELAPCQARSGYLIMIVKVASPIFTILSFLEGVVRLAYSTIRLFFWQTKYMCITNKNNEKACARVIENQQQPAPTPIHPSSLIPKNGNGYSNHHGICYFRMDGLAPPALFDKSACYHTHTPKTRRLMM